MKSALSRSSAQMINRLKANMLLRLTIRASAGDSKLRMSMRCSTGWTKNSKVCLMRKSQRNSFEKRSKVNKKKRQSWRNSESLTTSFVWRKSISKSRKDSSFASLVKSDPERVLCLTRWLVTFCQFHRKLLIRTSKMKDGKKNWTKRRLKHFNRTLFTINSRPVRKTQSRWMVQWLTLNKRHGSETE